MRTAHITVEWRYFSTHDVEIPNEVDDIDIWLDSVYPRLDPFDDYGSDFEYYDSDVRISGVRDVDPTRPIPGQINLLTGETH